MTLNSGTGQACAACKYQRRRCTSECLLAPFFPADQPKMFQNVHRLFGVKNIQNLLKDLGPNEKAMAMKSIKFHANQREKYPVYGCLVDIQQLNYQIQMVEEELQAVLQQLAYYKQQQQHQQQETSSPINDYFSKLQLGVAHPGDVPLVHEENPLSLVASQPQVSCSNSDNVDYDINYLDFKDNNVVNSSCQQSNDNNPNTMPHTMPIQQGTIQVDYNEMHPFFDRFDDTQSNVGSKEAYESRFSLFFQHDNIRFCSCISQVFL
ncbi:hypothetical protein CDL12_15375 [Handroanthus impetiginosus]|uniref:LOB domain-containing protein n=1 Tax=Handroanthus impetiginosus TaxID=429701 RepID=A0A2G9H3A0_9LAMI|nr:hypothetical protein CDL12_15375 [Handroanthus impetiginosus]